MNGHDARPARLIDLRECQRMDLLQAVYVTWPIWIEAVCRWLKHVEAIIGVKIGLKIVES